ncbi:MAG: hypothetical protein ACKVX9_13435, partial [Blastocatellia bacterium]
GLLHNRLRIRLLDEKGVVGLESDYDARLRAQSPHPTLSWYAGYAALLAAEYHRHARRDEKALASYERAISHFDRSNQAHPDWKSTADHCAALALAGRARLALERKEFESSLNAALACFLRKPDVGTNLFGLTISPVETARMIVTQLKEQKLEDLAARLDAALAKLPREFLQLPAWERDPGVSQPSESRPPRRRRPPAESRPATDSRPGVR